MAAQPPLLTEDQIDDLLHHTRTASLPDLSTLLSTLSTTHSLPPATILALASDPHSQNTPLHYAAANNHLAIVSYLLSLLPASPSSPDATAKSILNAQNSAGNTPLHWAALNGHLEIVKLLVGAGADPGVRNGQGRDAIVEAERASEVGDEGKGKRAGECAVWMLENWGGVEEGVGGVDGGEEGEVDRADGVNGEGKA